MELLVNENRKCIINQTGHQLVIGGPGSGKTTVALLKALNIVEKSSFKEGQRVLFLSFARATVSNIETRIKSTINKKSMSKIEVNTYHGFMWGLLKYHGYLLNEKSRRILLPHEANVFLSEFDKDEHGDELYRLYEEQGLIHFDLFAHLCTELFQQSNAIRNIMSDVYPFIIIDEFQDTSSEEWELIKILGKSSTLMALADPDQRIYDFRGAQPERLMDFVGYFSPSVDDLGQDNYRSSGTDICEYGNDILSGKNKHKFYTNVFVVHYHYTVTRLKHFALKIEVMKAVKRLRENNPDKWSVAVLVPTNVLMLEVSNYLDNEQSLKNGKRYPMISHDVMFDPLGPTLAGILIAGLMSQASVKSCTEETVINYLCDHIQGRRQNLSPNHKDIVLAKAMRTYLSTNQIRGKNRRKLLEECKAIAVLCNKVEFSGNVLDDWKSIRKILDDSSEEYINQVAKDSRYIRLLKRGSQLYSSLSNTWKENYNYYYAEEIVTKALSQEHFQLSTQEWHGVNVMTIHKAKGKEFDEVIVYETFHQNRILIKQDRIDQAKLNLRVAVTRAKKRTTILTPETKPCELV